MDLLTERRIESGVAVWHTFKREWVSFIPCPGEKRVRLDVHDSLEFYEVFPVSYHPDGHKFDYRGESPLPYRIDLS